MHESAIYRILSGRMLWNGEYIDAEGRRPETDYKDTKRHLVGTLEEANLVSSHTESRLHMPAIDLDVKAALIASSTPGHSHLYINVPMTWWRYRMLLRELYKAGIINKGFYKASIQRKGSFLRRPGILKPK